MQYFQLSASATQNSMIRAYFRLNGKIRTALISTSDAALARCEFNKLRYRLNLPITSGVLMVEEIAEIKLKKEFAQRAILV